MKFKDMETGNMFTDGLKWTQTRGLYNLWPLRWSTCSNVINQHKYHTSEHIMTQQLKRGCNVFSFFSRKTVENVLK